MYYYILQGGKKYESKTVIFIILCVYNRYKKAKGLDFLKIKSFYNTSNN